MEMDQAAHDDDFLAVPAGRQSEHSTVTSSAPEVEDCEDLEVVGLQSEDSETNIVGATWTNKATVDDHVTGGETFTKIEGLTKIPGHGSHRFIGDNEIDSSDNVDADGAARDTAINPNVAECHQSYTHTGRLSLNPDIVKCPGNSENRNDTGDSDKDEPQYVDNKSSLATFHPSSAQTEESRELSGQYERSENHAAEDDDDFDDDDDDDDGDEPIKPTFSPFTVLSAAAGGDHSSAVNETKNIFQDSSPVAATIATAIDTEPVPKDQPFCGVSSDDRNALDEVGNDGDKVDNVCKKNGAIVPSDSFDEVFARNQYSQPETLDQSRTVVETDTRSNNTRRLKFSREHVDVEELDETVAGGQTLADDREGGMSKWTSSTTRVLNPSNSEDGSESEEEVEMFGSKTVNGTNNELNTITSVGEREPACYKTNRNEAENKVREYNHSL